MHELIVKIIGTKWKKHVFVYLLLDLNGNENLRIGDTRN